MFWIAISLSLILSVSVCNSFAVTASLYSLPLSNLPSPSLPLLSHPLHDSSLTLFISPLSPSSSLFFPEQSLPLTLCSWPFVSLYTVAVSSVHALVTPLLTGLRNSNSSSNTIAATDSMGGRSALIGRIGKSHLLSFNLSVSHHLFNIKILFSLHVPFYQQNCFFF